MVEPRAFYSRRDVAEEIAWYSRRRWVAVVDSRGVWRRWRGDEPLRVEGPGDVARLAEELGARSFYASVEVYRRLESKHDVMENYDLNVEAATPLVDVDVVDEEGLSGWPFAVRAAQALVEALRRLGVEKSVYILWSGAGFHVRVNEAAVDWESLEVRPVDGAFALAELALRLARRGVEEAVRASGGAVKAENVVRPRGVATAPLSLHRRVDRVAVALKPEDLDLFTPAWSDPEAFRHDREALRRYVKGEATDAVARALREVAPGSTRTVIAAPAAPAAARQRSAAPAQKPGRVGRFPVMALLQAARYYLLTGDEEKAKSFGLNRAIFYAWAKYHGPARSAARRLRQAPRSGAPAAAGEGGERLVEVIGEKVKVGPRGWYSMGGVEQTPEDFERNVARKFEEAGIPFQEAWRAALDYVAGFPERVLRDPQRFYKEVYEPVRDVFVEKVVLGEWRPRRRPSPQPRRPPEPGAGREKRGPVGLDKWLTTGEDGEDGQAGG